MDTQFDTRGHAQCAASRRRRCGAQLPCWFAGQVRGRLDFTNRPETAIPFSEVSVMQSVSPDVETRASRAASYHPLWAQATAHAYCATDVSVEAVNLIGRMRSLTDTTREELLKALLTENSVLVVSCWTSEKQPEPLAGGGKHYVFLLHPDSFQVLHAGIGTWRA